MAIAFIGRLGWSGTWYCGTSALYRIYVVRIFTPFNGLAIEGMAPGFFVPVVREQGIRDEPISYSRPRHKHRKLENLVRSSSLYNRPPFIDIC